MHKGCTSMPTRTAKKVRLFNISRETMQHHIKQYNPDHHDKFRALTVKQPFADCLITPAFTDADGITYGEKSVEIRSHRIKYRGDILICSSCKGLGRSDRNGVAVGFVELFDVKPIADFTEDDWYKSRVSRENWDRIKKGFGWCFRNPRPVVEMPTKGQMGLWNAVYDKGDIITYPTAITLDYAAWRQIMEANYDKLAFPLPAALQKTLT